MKRFVLVVASAGALLVGMTVPVHAAPQPPAQTCAGGQFPTAMTPVVGGTYSSLTVTGACVMLPGTVLTVTGNIDVAPGAVLDAQTFPSTISVGHNVTAGTGSLLGLGCQPDAATHTGHECGAQLPGSDDLLEGRDQDVAEDGSCIPEVTNPFACLSSSITVMGNVTTSGADTVLLNGITVEGNVSLSGGGGDIPWSIKNNTIGGNLSISDVTADWLGMLFNTIGKNATLTNITATDPGDPGRLIFVVRNTIGWNLICQGLEPGVSGGFNPRSVDIVGRQALGQCAPLIYPRV